MLNKCTSYCFHYRLIKIEKFKNLWRDNKKCEEEILSRAATLIDATLEHLEKSNAALLQAFVRVRRNVDSTEKMPRKGKAKEVLDKVRDKTASPCSSKQPLRYEILRSFGKSLLNSQLL
jgi:hypothetical protein